MSNIAKLEFEALNVNGDNYMSWCIDVESNLESMMISETINEGNFCSSHDKAKAIVFLRKHIDQMLKFEYLNISDPCILWNKLKERFDHQRDVMLPAAIDEWRNLRFQDFKKVKDYNSALFRIISKLNFCGHEVKEAEMLEKTLSTFHASNITLQQQYRLQKFTKYSDLVTMLLVAEQNNDLLIKNHESRPTGSVAFPEINATSITDPKDNKSGRGRGHSRGRGRGRGRNYNNSGWNHYYDQNYNSRHYVRGRGRGHGRGRGRGRGNNNYTPQDQPQKKLKFTGNDVGTSKNHEGPCYRCGLTGHWAKTCRTPEHFCKLYQDSLKEKEKEVNLIDGVEFVNTDLNVQDFCNDMGL